MFSWIGFFGKLVEHIAKKVVDKTIDPTSDSRKGACKAFIALHDAIIAIEFLTADFIAVLEDAKLGKKSIKQWMQNHAEELDLVSSNFLDSMSNLSGAIAFYDPNLSNLLSVVISNKKGFLRVASFPSLGKRIILGIDERGLLNYTEPDDEVMRVDLNYYYEKINKMNNAGIQLEWPEGVVAALLRDHVVHRSLDIADRERVDSMVRVMRQHLEVLKQARTSLRSFIREEFSIEDLLFVTRR